MSTIAFGLIEIIFTKWKFKMQDTFMMHKSSCFPKSLSTPILGMVQDLGNSRWDFSYSWNGGDGWRKFQEQVAMATMGKLWWTPRLCLFSNGYAFVFLDKIATPFLSIGGFFWHTVEDLGKERETQNSQDRETRWWYHTLSWIELEKTRIPTLICECFSLKLFVVYNK